MCSLWIKRSGLVLLVIATIAFMGVSPAWATIPGLTGTTFDLSTGTAHISCGDGYQAFIWGYADDNTEVVQYPGPTLIVDQGDEITVNLTNTLPEPVSIIFPGQTEVVAAEVSAPSVAGELALEADTGGTVSYTFTATEPGTYMYQSGSNMDIQVEMGLFGALIVRPTEPGFNDGKHAYNHADSQFDREVLFLLSEMDLAIHEMVEYGEPVDSNDFYPVYWFINGRNAPDTIDKAGAMAPWFPHQPYNCMPRINPGDRLLLRYIGGGRDPHPFHNHGNNFDIIARDGRLLSSNPGVTGADLTYSVFTIGVFPGTTFDGIFTWTGAGLGWDIYGTGPDFAHDCIDGDMDDFDDVTHEYCPDHGKPFPVTLPENQEVTVGDAYSGSPFLGGDGVLPPGQGALNKNGGYFYMWHSHNEKEMVNNDIFPGGMMTMLIVEPWWVEIPE